uniref:SCAN box domain-containing protein n=1 Tax=Spermophilus dauricus TaxID=99837 RepID=A0A8C9PX72_SPEDA
MRWKVREEHWGGWHATTSHWKLPSHSLLLSAPWPRHQICLFLETPGPREALIRLWVLCCEWRRPERHTKEQILDILVLEQFLTILPEELWSWVGEHHPKNEEEAVTMLEDLEKGLEPRPQVYRPCRWTCTGRAVGEEGISGTSPGGTKHPAPT